MMNPVQFLARVPRKDCHQRISNLHIIGMTRLRPVDTSGGQKIARCVCRSIVATPTSSYFWTKYVGHTELLSRRRLAVIVIETEIVVGGGSVVATPAIFLAFLEPYFARVCQHEDLGTARLSLAESAPAPSGSLIPCFSSPKDRCEGNDTRRCSGS